MECHESGGVKVFGVKVLDLPLGKLRTLKTQMRSRWHFGYPNEFIRPSSFDRVARISLFILFPERHEFYKRRSATTDLPQLE